MVQTGIMQRWQGKVKAAALILGAGGIINAASGIAGKTVVAQRLAMTVTATANTDFTMSLPTGATLLRATVYTGTAFLAATDAKVSIGVSAGDQTYVAQATIKALGVYALTLVAAASAALLSLPAPVNLFVRITQTGTTSATGAATLVVEYAI